MWRAGRTIGAGALDAISLVNAGLLHVPVEQHRFGRHCRDMARLPTRHVRG